MQSLCLGKTNPLCSNVSSVFVIRFWCKSDTEVGLMVSSYMYQQPKHHPFYFQLKQMEARLLILEYVTCGESSYLHSQSNISDVQM